jgi:hypothetical protein
MFNLFNKKKKENPISDVFNDLTTNQKMSVINLLVAISVCDPQEDFNKKECDYINRYLEYFGLTQKKCNDYLELGQQNILKDLQNISQFQKEFLIVSVYEMINSNGTPKEIKFYIASRIFTDLGISEDKFKATISKAQSLLNHFS